jgi:hypothetical protein
MATFADGKGVAAVFNRRVYRLEGKSEAPRLARRALSVGTVSIVYNLIAGLPQAYPIVKRVLGPMVVQFESLGALNGKGIAPRRTTICGVSLSKFQAEVESHQRPRLLLDLVYRLERRKRLANLRGQWNFR